MSTNFIHRAPAYGILDDEKTRPGVVLVNWRDDEATVRIAMPSFVRPRKVAAPSTASTGDIDASMFRGRWRGIGRAVGFMVLAGGIGLCAAIGLLALLEPAGTQAETRAAWHEVPQR